MATRTNGARQNGHSSSAEQGIYERSLLGFRNYWYPSFLSNEVTEKPRPMQIMGDEIVFLRRNGKAYALLDECPHRGTRLSRGKYEFPGTNTLTCRYHGWTFDVKNGACVGALTDGPESPVVGKVRVRSYPVEERQGIIWIWMGKAAPVPVEEDIPPALLSASIVKVVVRRRNYGNWRWHVENVGSGHAAMLHRDSIHTLFTQMPAYAVGSAPVLEEEGADGEWVLDRASGGRRPFGDYPGLGRWPTPRKWRRGRRGPESPLLGVKTKVSVKLPCITRVPHFPITGSMYYEWYVQNDEDHYDYFQVATGHPKSLREKLSWYLRFYGWGRYTGMVRFNSQDLGMVRDSHDFDRRHNGNVPSKLYGPDAFQLAWRKYAVENVRGEGGAPSKAAEAEPEREAVSAAAE